jgi:hypothetical protein
MRRALALLVLPAVAAGCAGLPFGQPDDEGDFRVPLVCLPKHKQIPCTGAVEDGVGYSYTLQTHCGVEWAYFDGRFWIPRPKVMTPEPSFQRNFTSGRIMIVRPGVAVFEADGGGSVRFAPAPQSFRPPPCA